MTDTYRFADKLIRIRSIYPDVHALCRSYAAQGIPVTDVVTTEEDIDYEMRHMADMSRGYAETLAVYRQISEYLVSFDTFLFHGSALAVDGECYIFTAPSGTGKSTHARLWRELLGDKVIMVNDDKPLIRVTKERSFAYGTPYDGKHRLSTDICMPIRAICHITRSEDNFITPLSPKQMLPTLLSQCYHPRNAAGMAKTLDLLGCLSANTAFYRLGANMDISAAKLSYETMRKKDET
ncbi:MAG: hypothetical protein IJ080_04645 [Oscillospiraceae bacterium]|nr:hypothetical protein [Oscillospiraceae bacterium]